MNKKPSSHLPSQIKSPFLSMLQPKHLISKNLLKKYQLLNLLLPSQLLKSHPYHLKKSKKNKHNKTMSTVNLKVKSLENLLKLEFKNSSHLKSAFKQIPFLIKMTLLSQAERALLQILRKKARSQQDQSKANHAITLLVNFKALSATIISTKPRVVSVLRFVKKSFEQR